MTAAAPALSPAARKARLVRAYLAGAPVHCTWQLSPRCESFCQACEHRAESASEELDTAGCAGVAEALGAEGTLLVSLTGSEPFLRSDLPDILAAVARRHFPLLVTNGWLVTPARARAAWQAGLEAATVAFCGGDPAEHDAVAGMPGAYARAVAALAALSRERTRRTQRLNVRLRLRGSEAHALPGLLEMAQSHDATVSLEAAFPLPQLDGETEGLVETLRGLKRRFPNLRSSVPLIARLGAALRGGVPGCLAGRAFFNVDHRGRVSKCLEFRAPADQVGTLASEPLARLRSRLRTLTAANDCRACFYASRAEVETLYTLRGLIEGLGTLVRA